jgi:hypothetical protein
LLATAFAELEPTSWEMPGQALSSDGFGPWAIAGTRFTALNKARVAPASKMVFISALRVIPGKFEPSDAAAIIQWAAVASPFDGGSAD